MKLYALPCTCPECKKIFGITISDEAFKNKEMVESAFKENTCPVCKKGKILYDCIDWDKAIPEENSKNYESIEPQKYTLEQIKKKYKILGNQFNSLLVCSKKDENKMKRFLAGKNPLTGNIEYIEADDGGVFY